MDTPAPYLPKLAILLFAFGVAAVCEPHVSAQAAASTAQSATQPAAASSPSVTAQSASASAAAAGKTYEFDVAASKQWIDTGLDLRTGEKLHVTATGSITYPAGNSAKSKPRTFGPDGLTRGWADLIHQYAVSDAGHGALIGRLGSGDAAQAFLLGSDKQYEAPWPANSSSASIKAATMPPARRVISTSQS